MATGLVLLSLASGRTPATGQLPDEFDGHGWRAARHPRIDMPPDPSRIRVVPDEEFGFARVVGQAGAAADRRAKIVRLVNLATADEVATLVRSDGSFAARLFAPAGSALQVSTLMLEVEELPFELRQAMRENGCITPSDMPHAEFYIGLIGSHVTSSPGTVIPLVQPAVSTRRWPAFVRKVGQRRWLLGSATGSKAKVEAGEQLDVDVQLAVVSDALTGDDVTTGRPQIAFALHRLFDRDGRQRSFARQPTSDVLTPTGVPIETHGEMMVEPRPDKRRVWNLLGTGMPVPHTQVREGEWRIEGPGHASLSQLWRLEIPAGFPTGCYGITAMIWGGGVPEFDAGEPAGGPWCLGYITVGEPAPPRLTCLLLGSTGTAGTRAAVARQDRDRFAINTKIAFSPDKLIIARDDAFTGEPIKYPLDPYVPMLGLMHRPPPVIPKPLIPLDCRDSHLSVTITTPRGSRETLGPAPLVALQNDLSVLRPDYVHPGRVMAPVAPSYGNPSASDMLHLTGRGAFDYAFQEYGHYQIELEGQVHDFGGTSYEISGTYDVYVARPLDIEIFPQAGTPLRPGTDIHPQVRVLPALAANVEMRWRHYPYSDSSRVVERTVRGKANRWGVFIPDTNEPPVRFTAPGEYSCDVTVEHQDDDGALWMACRRGASVVVTPDSSVVVHGERGNRSPTALWRARWFVAGDGRFIAPPERSPEELPRDIPPQERFHRMEMGHTCLPYESGDVAWLGHRMNFSLFPGITFEDPEGTLADLIENRWPAVRDGAGAKVCIRTN